MKKNTDKKILIIDDHPIVVSGLKQLLGQMEGIKVSGSAGNAFDGVAFLKKETVDIVLLDINLPDINGIDLCKKIKTEFPSIKIIGISTFSNRSYVLRMIESGALGYLIKSASAEEIIQAINTVLEGKLYLSLDMESLVKGATLPASDNLPTLTKREKEILQLIIDGLTNNQIAEKLFISPLTVESHRKNLMTKLGVNNTAALVRFALEKQLMD